MPSSFLIWWYKHSPVRSYTIQYGSTYVDWKRILCEDERPEAYWWKRSFIQFFFRQRQRDDNDGDQVEVSADMDRSPAPPAPPQPSRVPDAPLAVPPPEEEFTPIRKRRKHDGVHGDGRAH
eukprot:9468746-Pyramimonas_sp.AAC.1